MNSFKISVKEFVERTNAISLQAKIGRYGGTYAHKDIAFEFGSWLRELAKINYRIHTDAIKQNLIPPELTPQQKSFVYADKADMLNVAMFGQTAREWRKSRSLSRTYRVFASKNSHKSSRKFA